MKTYLLGIALMIAGAIAANSPNRDWNSYNEALVFSGFWVFVFAVLRTLWNFFNAATVARKAGEIAAKGANHVDTFKDAFKDGRNK